MSRSSSSTSVTEGARYVLQILTSRLFILVIGWESFQLVHKTAIIQMKKIQQFKFPVIRFIKFVIVLSVKLS